MFRILFSSFLGLQLFVLSPAWADVREGQAAFDAGDYRQAHALWLTEAQAGNAEAQASLGELYLEGLGVDRDYQQALEWYRLAAGQNSPVGLYMLGMMHMNGTGVPADMSTAVRLVGQASEMGFAPAQMTVTMFRTIGYDAPGTPWKAPETAKTVDEDVVRDRLERLFREAPPKP